jgi:hypothetical protein
VRKHAQLLGYEAPQKSFEPLQITLETKATTTTTKKNNKKVDYKGCFIRREIFIHLQQQFLC